MWYHGGIRCRPSAARARAGCAALEHTGELNLLDSIIQLDYAIRLD